MINILLFSLITNTMFYAYGHLINYDNSLNIFEKVINKSIIGAIVVSIVAFMTTNSNVFSIAFESGCSSRSFVVDKI